MKVIRCINNNVAVCIDSTGHEIVAFGKGIGFKKPPFEVDLSQLDRTYYDIDETYISMISDIPEEVFKASTIIVNKARAVLDSTIRSTIVFTLADHINFCIKRYEKNLNIKLPITVDIEYLFEKEYKLGLYGIKVIKDICSVYLPKDEAAFIALHIINAEEKDKNLEYDDDRIVAKVIKIIERVFEISINKKDVNYSRFVSHLHYLLKRGKSKHLISSQNDYLFVTVRKEYPKSYQCATVIADCLKKELNIDLTSEEILYLMLHINRLCTREDCNH